VTTVTKRKVTQVKKAAKTAETEPPEAKPPIEADTKKQPDGVRTTGQAVGEKESILGVAMMIIAGGMMTCFTAAQAVPPAWQNLAAGGVLVLIGFGVLFLRGLLKTNRWSHLYKPITIIPALKDDTEEE
jgi:hypothetical protein